MVYLFRQDCLEEDDSERLLSVKSIAKCLENFRFRFETYSCFREEENCEEQHGQ